ncbi:MAG: leucyl/phenylalanyl-tRNA--protein transferase [Burkholderiales bacterium]
MSRLRLKLNTGHTIAWLEQEDEFPPCCQALEQISGLNGLLAASADVGLKRLIRAYSQGIFPWYSEGQPVLWWSPDPRMVLYLDEFKGSRSLRKNLIQAGNAGWVFRIDSDFEATIRACAYNPRPGQQGTWITDAIMEHYVAMHRLGMAHSFEAWQHGNLLGGGYGVSLGRMFYGESMFTRVPNASKLALAGLIHFLRQHGFVMIDCQQKTPHLGSLGAREIPRQQFLNEMQTLRQQTPLTNWATTLPMSEGNDWMEINSA